MFWSDISQPSRSNKIIKFRVNQRTEGLNMSFRNADHHPRTVGSRGDVHPAEEEDQGQSAPQVILFISSIAPSISRTRTQSMHQGCRMARHSASATRSKQNHIHSFIIIRRRISLSRSSRPRCNEDRFLIARLSVSLVWCSCHPTNIFAIDDDRIFCVFRSAFE
jgi:hypothetical protein